MADAGMTRAAAASVFLAAPGVWLSPCPFAVGAWLKWGSKDAPIDSWLVFAAGGELVGSLRKVPDGGGTYLTFRMIRDADPCIPDQGYTLGHFKTVHAAVNRIAKEANYTPPVPPWQQEKWRKAGLVD